MEIPALDLPYTNIIKSIPKPTEKKKAPRRRWNKNFHLLSVEYPIELGEKSKTRLFSITLYYLN